MAGDFLGGNFLGRIHIIHIAIQINRRHILDGPLCWVYDIAYFIVIWAGLNGKFDFVVSLKIQNRKKYKPVSLLETIDHLGIEW